MRLFDSHLHLTDAAFREDRGQVLDRAREQGVMGMVTVASDLTDARAALELAGDCSWMWCTAGLHPHEADRFGPATTEALEMLAREPEVVAIGETGLDFHYDHGGRDAQRASFEAQLDLAARTDLPVVVHSREADAETEAMIRAFAGRVRGVLHCFTGGPALLETALDADWYVSFSGIVTFKAFGGADQVRRVPRDRLLIETDSPYLAPVPRRGKRNEPAFLAHTCTRVADLRGESAAAVAEQTQRNALALYGLTDQD